MISSIIYWLMINYNKVSIKLFTDMHGRVFGSGSLVPEYAKIAQQISANYLL